MRSAQNVERHSSNTRLFSAFLGKRSNLISKENNRAKSPKILCSANIS
jgi:hypothetical protein